MPYSSQSVPQALRPTHTHTHMNTHTLSFPTHLPITQTFPSRFLLLSSVSVTPAAAKENLTHTHALTHAHTHTNLDTRAKKAKTNQSAYFWCFLLYNQNLMRYSGVICPSSQHSKVASQSPRRSKAACSTSVTATGFFRLSGET